MPFTELYPCIEVQHQSRMKKISHDIAYKIFEVTKDRTSVWVYFTKPEMTEIDTTLITSVFDFISGIGGNLGLFLGFSLIATLYAIYDQLIACFSKVVECINVK